MKIGERLHWLVRRCAKAIAWLTLVLIGVILAQVTLRYGFHAGQVVLEELMWHLYALVFLFGLAHGVSTNRHIRVDLLTRHGSARTRAWIDIIGILTLLAPFLVVVLHHGLEAVAESFRLNESSTSPQGLPYRWAIKAALPLAMGLLALAALARLLDQIALLRGKSHGS